MFGGDPSKLTMFPVEVRRALAAVQLVAQPGQEGFQSGGQLAPGEVY